MKVSASGGDYKPVPEGTYVATCVRVIDLGTQVTTWKGADKIQRKVLIGWEVPEVRVQDQEGRDMPAMISTRYTASLHEKAALRKALEAWRGRRFTDDELKGFDLKNVLAQPCQIQVLHSERDGTTYANVSAIMAMPKGAAKPAPEHPTINFSLDEGEFSEGVYGMLTDRLREIIAQSPEYKEATGQASARPQSSEEFSRDLDDEIPF
jgi:hypothetical protein